MSSEPIEFRVFCPGDLPEIMRIQDANCISNLSQEQRADGFLSVAFSASQFVAMHREIPVVVADCGHHLGGFMCGCTLASGARVPLLGRMISLFPQTLYKGRPLDQYTAFIYGPVCVDRAYRGKGVIEGLFGAFLAQLAGRYDVGALFALWKTHDPCMPISISWACASCAIFHSAAKNMACWFLRCQGS